MHRRPQSHCAYEAVDDHVSPGLLGKRGHRSRSGSDIELKPGAELCRHQRGVLLGKRDTSHAVLAGLHDHSLCRGVRGERDDFDAIGVRCGDFERLTAYGAGRTEHCEADTVAHNAPPRRSR